MALLRKFNERCQNIWLEVSLLYRETNLNVEKKRSRGHWSPWQRISQFPRNPFLSVRSQIEPNRFNVILHKDQFKNLRKLVVTVTSQIDFDLNNINQFQRLEELNISIVKGVFCYAYGEIGPRTVKLPKLQAFAAGSLFKTSVTIESPKLNELSIAGFITYPGKSPRPLTIVYPETVRSLTTNRSLEEINFLINLECLRTWNSFLLTEHKANLLRIIPKLRIIYYEVHERMGRAYRSWTFRMLQKLLYDFRVIRPSFRIGFRLMTDRREIEIYPRNHETIQGNVPFLSDRRRSRRWQ